MTQSFEINYSYKSTSISEDLFILRAYNIRKKREDKVYTLKNTLELKIVHVQASSSIAFFAVSRSSSRKMSQWPSQVMKNSVSS